MTYRQLAAQTIAEKDYDSFLSDLNNALTDGRQDPNDVVRDTLIDIYYPGTPHKQLDELSAASRARSTVLIPET